MTSFPDHSGPPPHQRRVIGRIRARARILAYLRLAAFIRRRIHGH